MLLVRLIKFHLTNGDSTSISELKGKVIVLQFTASWCSVCRKEMPHLEKEIWQEIMDSPLLPTKEYKYSDLGFYIAGEIVKRLSGRRSCPKCQATYHVEFAPSKEAGVCDRCKDTLVQRSDDQREAIETRLKVYEEQTAPLIGFYEKKNILSHLESEGPVESVYQSLSKVLAAYDTA